MKFKGLVFLGLCGAFLLFLSGPSFAQTFPFYVLDGYGGIHAGGGAAAISPVTPYFGWDIAKSIQYVAVGNSTTNYGHGILVLDGYGGIHKGGKLSTVSVTATPYFGFNIARSMSARIIPPRAAYSTYVVGNTEVTSTSYISIRSVDLYLPDDGYVLVTGTASMGNNDSVNGAKARVALGVDSLTAMDDIEAEVALYPYNATFATGTFFNMTRSQMIFVSAGPHTFYFLVKKTSTTGQVIYFYPHISVIYVDQSYYGYSKPDVTAPPSANLVTGAIK